MCGGLFGDDEQQTKIPDFLKDAGKDITERASGIASQPYTPYTGSRFAPYAQNLGFASNIASNLAGTGQANVDAAANMFNQSARSVTDMNVANYMNPYLNAVLDPQVARIEEQYGKLGRQINDQAAAAGAFGGSRHGVREGEMDDDRVENLMDLYGRGYSSAFDNAMGLITNEFARQANAGQGLLGAAGTESALVNDDLNRLLTTGAQDQNYAQQQADFDYQQFLENRDWEVNRLMPYISAVGGIPYSTTQTGTGSSPFSQVAGAGLSAASLLLSDRDSKENITPAPETGTLDLIEQLAMFDYEYKPEVQSAMGPSAEGRRRGPMAQDYAEIFGLEDDKTIPFPHLMGVVLSGMKELSRKVDTALAA